MGKVKYLTGQKFGCLTVIEQRGFGEKDCLFNDGDGPNEDDKYWCALHQSFMQYCSEAKRKKETCNNTEENLQ